MSDHVAPGAGLSSLFSAAMSRPGQQFHPWEQWCSTLSEARSSQLRSTYFWRWLCHRLSKGLVWIRLSKCSLKGTAKEAKSKIKCRSQLHVRTVASIIPQQQHPQQNVPKARVSSPLTSTHPEPNTRKAEHRCQCSQVGSKHSNEDPVGLT